MIIFYIGLIVISAMAFLMSNIYEYLSNNDNYLFSSGDLVWFYDEDDDLVKRLKIRHKMSGWDECDWEYYNCIGENYETDGNDIYEVSQKDLFSNKDDAKLRRKKVLENLLSKKEKEVNKFKAQLV